MIVRVFLKLFTKEFYRVNAFFFLVCTGLAFGFMSGVEHTALAEFFISSNLLIVFPIILWVLYAIKVVLFNTHSVHQLENRFLHQCPYLAPSLLFISLTLTLIIQLAPILLYATFLILTAINNNYLATTPAILGTLLLLITIGVVKLHHDLKNPATEINPTPLKVWLDRKLNRSFPLMTLEWVIRNYFLTCIGSKFLSLIVLVGAIELYSTDTYDYRLLAMASTIAFTSNIMLIMQVHHFENKIFSIYKNMPIPFYKRGVFILIVLLVFCLPEIGLLVSRLPSSEIPFLLILPYAISILIALYGFLFISDWSFDSGVRVIFFFTMGLIVLILFKIPMLFMTLSLTIVGIYPWKIRYYQYENSQP